jgi:hypothetical protein
MRVAREDVLVDCIAESSVVNDRAAIVTVETIEMAKRQLGVNLVLIGSTCGLSMETVNGKFGILYPRWERSAQQTKDLYDWR